jgi:hypothetical protein
VKEQTDATETTYEDMKTIQRTPAPQGSPPDQQQELPAKPGKVDLSLTQILGGALAAMTAAALGSRLGVAGTIVGAAVASVVAGVAGALYTASLRHTREKVKTVWSGRIGGTELPVSIDAVKEAASDAPVQAPIPAVKRPRRPLQWKAIVAGALAAFAIAAVVLTAFELVSGSALSGGHGTTIQQVTEPKAPAPDTQTKSSPSPSPSQSATPSSTPTQSPTPEVTPVAPENSAIRQPTPSTPETPTASPSSATPSSPDTATPLQPVG